MSKYLTLIGKVFF